MLFILSPILSFWSSALYAHSKHSRSETHSTVEICFWFRFGLVAIAIFNRFIILHFELCDQWFRNWCQVLSLEIPLNAFGNPNKTVVQRENCVALTSGDGCCGGKKVKNFIFDWMSINQLTENVSYVRSQYERLSMPFYLLFHHNFNGIFFYKSHSLWFIVFFLFHSIQSGKLLIL